MRLLVLLAVLVLGSLTSALAKEPYIGTFLYKYQGGNTFQVSVPNDRKLTWKCLSGAIKGESATEKPQRYKVADGIYFVTWIEKTGINVSQAINYNTGKVYTTVINGPRRSVHQGTVTRLN
jgi:phenolic acid decarboxylase